MNDSVLLRLLTVFVPLSLITVGGGQSIIAAIQRQSVALHWLTNAQFVNLYAIAKMSPGPGSIIVTLVGWQAAGWAGAMVASFAIFVPSSVLAYILARIWKRYRDAAWQRAIEAGLAPVAAAMVLSSTFVLMHNAPGHWLSWAVTLISGVVLSFTRINPFLMMGAGAVVFVVFWH